MKMPMTVTMHNGEKYEVVTNNADRTRWDITASRQGWPSSSDAPFLFATFLAWSALKREGLYAGDWETFLERDHDDIDIDSDALPKA